MKNLSILIGIGLITACNNNAATVSGDPDSVIVQNNEKPIKDTQEPARSAVITDSIIQLQLSQNGDTVFIRFLKRSTPVVCNFSLQKKGTLTASITTPSNKDNIRFNQILMPDGSADGPFGKTIDHTIKTEGNYKLIIGADLMAEDAYTGECRLTIALK